MNILKKIGTYSLIALWAISIAHSAHAQALNASTSVRVDAVAPSLTGTSTSEESEYILTFDDYVADVSHEDKNVVSISSDDASVSVWYRDRVRFLGLFPMDVTALATVNAEGAAKVSYPWYRFLTVYDKGELEADLEASAGAIARGEGGESLSDDAKARIVDAVRSVMRAHYEANLESMASTSSETSE